MSERDFAMCLALLAEAMGEKAMTPVRVEAYHRGLKDIPLVLLQATVDRLIREMGTETFRWTALPPVADIRKAAETIRREELAKQPYDGCIDCEAHKGWTPIDVNGVRRMTRCGCYRRHQAKLTNLGLTTTLASLPAAREDALDAEPPRALPPAVAEQITFLAGKKVM